MAYEYTPDQECDFCVRYAYTSRLTKNMDIVKLCVDHFKNWREN